MSTSVELAELPPGPQLGVVLAEVDLSRLNGHDLVLVMQAWARQLAYTQAQLSATVWEVSICPPGPPDAPVQRRAKDQGHYRLRQLEHGHLEWTTPLGHTYHTDPD
ncbi:MAG: hypothetical protein ACM30G_06850 [Micromonosporaceae bacterium]